MRKLISYVQIWIPLTTLFYALYSCAQVRWIRQGKVTYSRMTSALKGQMIRHLRSRRAQRPEREPTPNTRCQRTGMLVLTRGKSLRRNVVFKSMQQVNDALAPFFVGTMYKTCGSSVCGTELPHVILLYLFIVAITHQNNKFPINKPGFDWTGRCKVPLDDICCKSMWHK